MNSATHQNSNIPVLTEIVSIDKGAGATPAAREELSQPPTLPIQDQLNLGINLEELEKRLHENVLRQLLSRIDFVLEHRIRDGLAEVLQTAMDNLTQDIRQGLNKSLEEIIHRTINQEISKIQSLKSPK